MAATIPALLMERVTRTPDTVAFRWKDTDTWREKTWRSAHQALCRRARHQQTRRHTVLDRPLTVEEGT